MSRRRQTATPSINGILDYISEISRQRNGTAKLNKGKLQANNNRTSKVKNSKLKTYRTVKIAVPVFRYLTIKHRSVSRVIMDFIKNHGQLKEISSTKCFGGLQKVFSHESRETKCEMKFAAYFPSQALDQKQCPVIYWLSGLTCNELNFIQKAGAQQWAAELGLIIICPDTSPRGCNIPGEEDSWDFGTGAGFYLDAVQDLWSKNYRMFSYITSELPELVNKCFPVAPGRQSIMGHSMGGHGALICALKNPGLYASVSAFAPICAPTSCPWGNKAFTNYLGSDETGWSNWDATCLVGKYQGPPLEIFVDQGEEDQFLKDGQLQPEKLVEACAEAHMPIIMRRSEGYDHSYFFIATFIKDHLTHHAKYLFPANN